LASHKEIEVGVSRVSDETLAQTIHAVQLRSPVFPREAVFGDDRASEA
jgi:hypothetical protein